MLHKVIPCRAIKRFNEYSTHTQAICYEKISTHDVTLCQALQNYEHATHLKIIFE